MKRCPNCNRTYPDESLSFCLDDGTPLIVIQDPNQQSQQSYEPPPTLFMPEPPKLQTTQVESRTTAGGIPPQSSPQGSTPPPTQPSQPQSPFQSHSSLQQAPTFQGQYPTLQQPSQQQSPFQSVPTPTWQPPSSGAQGATSQPKKKGKLLPIAIGFIALVVVTSVGVLVILLVIAAMNSNSNENDNKPNINRQSSDNKQPNNNSDNNNQKNENTNENGNANNKNENTGNDVTPVSYLTNGFLSTSAKGGSSQTTFTPMDKIFFHFDVTDVPENKNFKVKFIIDEVIQDPSGQTKNGDSLENKVSFRKGVTDNWKIEFTPGKLGWPIGNYHVEILEVAPDDTLTKIMSIPFTVE